MKIILLCIGVFASLECAVASARVEKQVKAYQQGLSFIFKNASSKVNQNIFWRSTSDQECRVQANTYNSGEVGKVQRAFSVIVYTSSDPFKFPALFSFGSKPKPFDSQETSIQQRNWSAWSREGEADPENKKQVLHAVYHSFLTDSHPMIGFSLSALTLAKNSNEEIVDAKIDHWSRSDYQLQGSDGCYDLEKVAEFNFSDLKRVFRASFSNPKTSPIPTGCKLEHAPDSFANCELASDKNEITCKWAFVKLVNITKTSSCSVSSTQNHILKLTVVPDAQDKINLGNIILEKM